MIFGGLMSGINSLAAGGKMKRLSKKINPKDVTYEVSPYAQEQLDSARAEKNARMPGAAQAERNIYQNQANTLANIGRNATDSSQMLALATGVQGQTNDAFGNLGVADAQNRQMNVQNLNNALGVMTNENDKVYQDKLRKYQEAYNAKMALMNAGITNQANGLNQIGSTIDNAAMMAASMMTGGLAGGAGGASGLMGGLMGGGGQAMQQSSALYGQQRSLGAAQPFSLATPSINYSLIGR
jgi:uncharacterized protein YukE